MLSSIQPGRFSTRPLLLNVPVLAGVTLLIAAGQLLQWQAFPPLAGAERAWIVGSILAYSAALTGLAALLGGAANSAIVWTLLACASTIYLFDFFSYGWVAAHLSESVPLLGQYLWTHAWAMHSKLTALVGAIALLAAVFVALVMGIRRSMVRGRMHASPIRRVAAVTAALICAWGVDRAVSPHVLGLEAYEAKNRVLWQPGFWTPPHPRPPLAIVDVVPEFRQVAPLPEVAATLATLSPADVTDPLNVFVFVIDSLRDDAISLDVTPNLYRLKQRSLPVRAGVASSNVTHISWFSIAHATNPLYWSVAAHQEHSPGAAPLRVLKRLGYGIRAVSSPSLEYFGFERSVFGDSPSIAASMVDARTLRRSGEDLTDGDLDDRAMTRLTADLETLSPDSRAFYLVVLNASHHDYTWSERYTPRYLPFTSFVSVFKTASKDIGPLWNRYRNSLAFIDMLMGEFLQTLEARGLTDSSIVALTADHGEEFLERGNLVHSSALNRFQTHVPILIALPPRMAPRMAPIAVASHIDIFPTVLDALGIGRANGLFDGRSLLQGETSPVAFSAMASSYSPAEAIIDAGDYKLFLELEGSRKVGRSLFAKRLVGTKVVTGDDEPVVWERSGRPGSSGRPTLEALRERFRPALQKLVAGDLGF